VLPALERMTTKPESDAHHHDGPIDIDGHTGIERAKIDDREDRKQLKGQSQGDVLEGGFLLAMSEDYDAEDVEKRQHPYHQALDALRLLLHEGLTKKGPERSAEQERVRTWTQERFKLAEDETIMVSELPCSDPGCPPVETHVVFWTQAGRQHFKVFKPLAEVAADDLLDWRA
jgi:nitrate reductase delta subunit